MKRPYTSAFFTAAVIILLGAARAYSEPSGSTAAFRQIASLAGEWIGVQNGESILLSYTLIADRSTLVGIPSREGRKDGNHVLS